MTLLPILPLFLIVHHGEIRLITALSDIVVLECLEYRTTRFVGVGAVGEAAVFGEPEYLGEVAGELLRFDVEGAEALDARRVDDPAATHGNHLREGGGVLAEVMGIGDLCRAQVGIGHQLIDEGGLPYPAVATEQGDLVFEQGAQRINTVTCGGRDLPAGVTDGLVKLYHHLLVTALVGIEQVGLVEDEDHRHPISLSRCQKAIDEGSGGLRVVDSDHQKRLIDIRRQDMTLFGEVLRLADDVVTAVFDLGDETFGHANPVTHGYRVGGADTLQSEVTFYFTVNQLAIVCQNGVPAACIPNDQSFQ